MLPVYEETKQALNFDPDAEHEFDTELPPALYPSTMEQWLTFLQKEASDAVIITGPADAQIAGGGETVPCTHDDSAEMGTPGTADSNPDAGGPPAVPGD